MEIIDKKSGKVMKSTKLAAGRSSDLSRARAQSLQNTLLARLQHLVNSGVDDARAPGGRASANPP